MQFKSFAYHTVIRVCMYYTIFKDFCTHFILLAILIVVYSFIGPYYFNILIYRCAVRSSWTRRCVSAGLTRHHFVPTVLWPATTFALLLFLLHYIAVRIEVSGVQYMKTTFEHWLI